MTVIGKLFVRSQLTRKDTYNLAVSYAILCTSRLVKESLLGTKGQRGRGGVVGFLSILPFSIPRQDLTSRSESIHHFPSGERASLPTTY